MRLRNISPLGQLDVPALNRQGGVEFDDKGLPIRVEGSGCLEPGEEFDCPDELAGRAPSENDRGSGLLAQVGVFEAVDEKKKRG